MKKETFSRFDAADYLKSEADIASYLDVAAESGDAAELASALGDVARARNMSALARKTGLTRQGLHKALSPDGSPSLATAMRVLSALGLQFTVRKAAPMASKKGTDKKPAPRKRSAA